MSRVRQAPVKICHSSPTLRRLATLGLTAVAVLGATFGGLRTAGAQDGISAADKKALQDYKLTLDKLDKLEAVTKKIVAAAKADPQIKKELQALNGEKEGSIDAINATFDKLAPHVAAVLKSEGIDAHDYLLGTISMMLASMGSSAKAAGGNAQTLEVVPAENMEFVEKNQARFEQVSKTMSELDEVGKPE